MGLAQREIETAGFSTITLSNIPELTAAVSVPRLVGIEYPFGQILGRPGTSQGQLAVLQGVLNALEEMQQPGSISCLPFKWDSAESSARFHPQVPPPIVGYLKRHPWQMLKLLARDPP